MPEAAQTALALDEPLVAPAAEPVVPAEGGEPAQNTGEQAPPIVPEVKPEEVITPEQAAKREGRRFGRKLDAANRRAAEERARADFLDAKLKELTPTAPVSTGVPKVENFITIEEYETATAKYYREQGFKDYQTAQQTRSNKQAQERFIGEWEAKAERAAAKYDDFDAVVGDLKPIDALTTAIMQADNAEDVAYFLGKNHDELRRIGNLEPIAQVRAIGRLEAKLLAEPPKPKTPSQAPAPITPLGGKSGGASDQPLDSDDINTWMRKENARMRKTAA